MIHQPALCETAATLALNQANPAQRFVQDGLVHRRATHDKKTVSKVELVEVRRRLVFGFEQIKDGLDWIEGDSGDLHN